MSGNNYAPSNRSIESNTKDKDCLPCKLTSAGGLALAGSYVIYHGKSQSTRAASFVVMAVGAGLVTLGICRVADLPPFRKLQSRKTSLLV